jgi:hypothetical protein
MGTRGGMRRLFGWSGVDQRMVEGLMLLACIGGVVAAGVALVRILVRGPVELGVDLEDAAGGERAGRFSLEPAESAALRVEDPTVAERAAVHLPDAVAALVVAVTAYLLWRLFVTLREGDPFQRVNVNRLLAAAWVIGVGGTLASLVGGLGRLVVLENAVSAYGGNAQAPFAMSFTLSFVPGLVALPLLAAAEFFRRGAALRADVEGLV